MAKVTISQEQPVRVLGELDAVRLEVLQDSTTGIIKQQVIRLKKGYVRGGKKFDLTVNLRFDDHCGNGKEDFAATVEQYWIEGSQKHEDCFGCCHDLIAEKFPALARFMKWHLCSVEEPMHYVNNTVYLAGDREYDGRAGEPNSWEEYIYLGNSPVNARLRYKPDIKLIKEWKKACIGAISGLAIVEVQGETSPRGFKYGPHYTFNVHQNPTWTDCPFENRAEAEGWLAAFKEDAATPGFIRFETVVTGYANGKPRQLDLARKAAVWPEATNEELCAPEEILTSKLVERLPALMTQFKEDMLALGFIYPERFNDELPTR